MNQNRQSFWSRILFFSPVLVLLVVVIVAGCGKSEEQLNKEQLAAEEIRFRETDGPDMSDEVMDSLRTMSRRYNVTREEYWVGKGGVLGNDFVEVWYAPGKTTVTHGMYALGQLVKARDRTKRYFGQIPEQPLKVVCAMTMPSYNEATDREWWVYCKIEGDEIYYQPVDIMFSRNILDLAVSRGYYEWSAGKLSGGNAPQWLVHGLASLLSDEDTLLEKQLIEYPGENVKMSVDEINGALDLLESKKDYRIALYNAFRMVRKLVAGSDRGKMVEAIRLMGAGDKAAKAFETAYGETYDQLLTRAGDFKVNR